MKTMKNRALKFMFFILLAGLSTACSSMTFDTKLDPLEEDKPNVVQIATLVQPNGKVKEIFSTDPKYLEKGPRIPNVRFAKNRHLCDSETKSEKVALRQQEIDLELSFLIKSLNQQPVRKTRSGKFKRNLSGNMLTNLYNTPNCTPYRFKLHIVKSLVEGSRLSNIEETIIR